MLDANGRLLSLGSVIVTGGVIGIVMCSIDTDEYTTAYPKELWAHLKSGVMVETKEIGLIWINEPSQIELKNSN